MLKTAQLASCMLKTAHDYTLTMLIMSYRLPLLHRSQQIGYMYISSCLTAVLIKGWLACLYDVFWSLIASLIYSRHHP
jgi:hypothetical protein